MFDYSITFDSPGYLALLALAPALWWWSHRRLAALGPARRIAALAVRSLVLVLLILALAEIQWVRKSDRLTVIYLLDQSASIPEAQRREMIDYVNKSILEHRREQDRVGVIVFGRDAAIEIPPFDDDVQVPSLIESLLDPEHTNLAGAMKLAQASFPEDAARRIVVVSDGNENLGNAVEQAQALAGAGIAIDVVPIRAEGRSEVIVERVSLPNDVRRGQPFDVRVVVTNTTKPSAGRTGEIPGRLILTKSVGDQTVVVSDETVSLAPGKQVFTIRQQIDEPAFYTWTARFVPDRPDDDGVPQNNRATEFVHIRGRGQVLLIEDQDNRGEFDLLVKRLRAQNMEVTVQSSDRLFSDLASLQPYDTVLLGNVPRDRFTDDQIEMLVRNTQQMGAGLVMLGGPNSFGAGGWANTKVEEALPVDCQIKSAKVIPRGALAMIMHASEMADGNHWQKVIAKEALKALGPRDYCGVIHWNGTDQWLWRGGLVEIGDSRKKMLAFLDRMSPGDMPLFTPAMQMANDAFAKLPDAAVKHMIIISDGDPTKATGAVLRSLASQKVTVTTVAVGAHGQSDYAEMQRIANATGGKYYVAKSPRALPRIFQREARRVAQPLVFESKIGVQPRIQQPPPEILAGIDAPLPALNGFVLTSLKESSLVEVGLVSPQPTDPKNSTILASWTYGLGRGVAFTTDTGARWTTQWTHWEGYDKLFGQMIRWSMRPTGQTGKYNVSTQVVDGRAEVVVTALDKNDEYLNFLNMIGQMIGPDLKPADVKLQQTAPGRYVGSFPAGAAGSYFIVIHPGPGQAPIRTGLNVPYSSEFRERSTNEGLLTDIARLAPRDGPPGQLIEAVDPNAKPEAKIRDWLAVNTFRHDLPKATSNQDVWHLIVLIGGCLFFLDVFLRRVQVSFAWAPAGLGRARDFVLRRKKEAPQPEFIERLRSRKAEVTDQIDRMRGDVRFEAPAEAPSDLGAVEELAGPQPAARPKPPPTAAPEPAQEESYTERLLKAKKKVWDGRKEEP
ncbi:MAG: VWA domain-containing protein [Pirellulales bacterium]|nr:VWA domain-containing protein [Pirellulales bacterium]